MRGAGGCALLACAALLLRAHPAFAQTGWAGRVHVDITAGVEFDRTLPSQETTLIKQVEATPLATELSNADMPVVSVGLAVRVIGDLGVGVSFSRVSHTGTAAVRAEIPHPFFFDRHRLVTGPVSLRREEFATHADLVYVINWRRIDVSLSGGATFFDVDQDVVSDVLYSEVYPYEAASFVSAELVRASASKRGYNVGADLTWRLARRWGVGALVRFSRARVPLTVEGVDYGVHDAGALEVGAGLRLRF